MKYFVGTVTDQTRADLEYGDYRGLVLLDDDGVCETSVDDLDDARRVYAGIVGADPTAVLVDEIPGDRGPFSADGYGRAWRLRLSKMAGGTNVIDLSDPPRALRISTPQRPRNRAEWVTTLSLVTVSLVAAAVVVTQLVTAASGGTNGAQPTFGVAVDPGITDYAQGTPTIVAYYADGTTGEPDEAITGLWTPDRPVVMLVVVADNSCSIVVDGKTKSAAGAPVNRNAVCVWRSTD